MPIQPCFLFMPIWAAVHAPGSESPVDRRKADFGRFVFPGAEHRKGGAANGKSRRTGENHPQMQ